MKTAIEQLRQLVMEGKETFHNREVRTFTLLQELTFIENRKQAEFLMFSDYTDNIKSLYYSIPLS